MKHNRRKKQNQIKCSFCGKVAVFWVASRQWPEQCVACMQCGLHLGLTQDVLLRRIEK
ncbi:hypothetical protein EI42_05756 [Thermosporothrix hazakensis]|jgi:transcription elongation factor Elf1|uniref:Uncharacterized protein n=1 Tax=Thermosporothrix hazakensis TaxID=644383 RepID=A0A326TVV3_THEHA|nr:hypothetical protein EI42_05756 [Thermosporothrix hazakensis]